MLKYLILQLDDSSTSFCHYQSKKTSSKLMSLEVLKNAVLWAMKENLTLQVLYPDHIIPSEYHTTLNRIDHTDIVNNSCEDLHLLSQAEVVVLNNWYSVQSFNYTKNQIYTIKTFFKDYLSNLSVIISILPQINRLNIVIADIDKITDTDLVAYKRSLEKLANAIEREYVNHHSLQLNLLTDRLILGGMNNCNAGYESITLAPDGNFYICPAFFNEDEPESAVGNLADGIQIKNPQLYKLDYAPICKRCDAWHCKRCVWLNKKMTLEVNTPSHEQCITAHTEREISRQLLNKLRKHGSFLPDVIIKQIDYNDPFDLISK